MYGRQRVGLRKDQCYKTILLKPSKGIKDEKKKKKMGNR